MALVGDAHLVYLPTPSFRALAESYVDPDDYAAIYVVRKSTHSPVTRPTRSELDEAHWVMFLALLADDYGELRQLSEELGFDACWEVHMLGIESGAELVDDARSLAQR